MTSALLWDITQLKSGISVPTFLDNLTLSYSRVKKSKKSSSGSLKNHTVVAMTAYFLHTISKVDCNLGQVREPYSWRLKSKKSPSSEP